MQWNGTTMNDSTSIVRLAAELNLARPTLASLRLDVGGFSIAVSSNCAPLIALLADYFEDLVVTAPLSPPDISISAIQTSAPHVSLPFREWPREPGKTGRKEVFADGADGRVVLKVRTGMQFLLGERLLMAVGPCRENSNQVVNFIISQYISRCLHEGWVLCHASAVAHVAPNLPHRGLAIAARAGAGKSTLALHLMSSGLSFVSNDRVLIRQVGHEPSMAGVPKMPRVNPGTLLNNPDLKGILPEARERAILKLSPREVWELEEKYDVFVNRVYGPGRCVYRAPIAAFLILNWSRSSDNPTRFESVQIASRPDLLELVLKSPGVFHRSATGENASESQRLDAAPYSAALDRVRVFEATGKADFRLGVSFCRGLLEAS